MSSGNICMVFIGESGSGKSTCVNYFANFFTNSSFDVTKHYDNMKIVIPNRMCRQINYPSPQNPHTERNIDDTTQSQTQECSEYNFNWDGRTVTIIDTPGFNDTDANRNDENIKKILTKLSRCKFISGLLITINGSNCKLSVSMKVTLNQLRSSLPDCIFQNLFFIFTNCLQETRTFNLELIAEFNSSPKRTFHMQNSLFCIRDKNQLLLPKTCTRMMESWKDSVETMGEIINEIKQASATTTRVFEEMLQRREEIVSNKAILITKLKTLLNYMKELEIMSKCLEDATNTMNANQKYAEDREIYAFIRMDTKPYYSTICTQHQYASICHEKCSLTFEPKLTLAHFERCAAADGKNCRHCKCAMDKHCHTYQIPILEKKKLSEIFLNMRQAYDDAQKRATTIMNDQMKLKDKKLELQIEVNDTKRKLELAVREMKRICSRFNFAEEMKTTIESLKMEAQIATDLVSKQEFINTASAIEALV